MSFHVMGGAEDEEESPRVDLVPMSEMGLRDWFAGQALPGIVQGVIDTQGELLATAVASHAYLIADAMMRERRK